MHTGYGVVPYSRQHTDQPKIFACTVNLPYKLVLILLYDPGSRLTILPLRHPHLLEGIQCSQYGPTTHTYRGEGGREGEHA